MPEKLPSRRVARCPICGRPAVEDMQPFCSARCADVDLNRWLSGAYLIRGADATDEPEAGSNLHEAEW